MSWKTFGGSHEEIYKALIQVRAAQDGFENPGAALTAHLHRGLSILLAKEMKAIEDLFMGPGCEKASLRG
jgi:hypothetical protein